MIGRATVIAHTLSADLCTWYECVVCPLVEAGKGRVCVTVYEAKLVVTDGHDAAVFDGAGANCAVI
jgi:hypothetical protein